MREAVQNIKGFMFSNMNKQVFIFLFFLLLSAVFWLILTLNETYEKELKVPVHIVNVPKNVVLTSSADDTLRITVRDKGWVILAYMYGEQRPKININFKAYDRGNGGGIISASDLKRISDQLKESTTRIVSIKPEKLEFFYNNGERKRVPIRWAGRVIPEQLYFISYVTYSPDSVDVYASAEKLDSIQVINTEPLNHVGFRDTLSVNCRLVHPSDVKVVPERITVNFHTDVLTEEGINVPVRCINLPAGKVLRTFPAKVRVNFVAGVGQIKSLRAEDFDVVADYLEIEQKPSEKCNIYLRNVPEGINRATLSARQVDYLIEEE
jgi:hypothetical protein